MADIISRTLSYPPVDTHYTAGLWHPSRTSLQGIWTELRVLGASLAKPTNTDVRKFLIISRARSGSTLLTRLLNDHPDVHCGREVLANHVLFPRAFLNRLAGKTCVTAYGAKLLSYQMVQVQRFRDPVGFLTRLQADGFRFIHLERDTFAQTFSLVTAQTSGIFHQRDERAQQDDSGNWGKHDESALSERSPIEIDIEDFIRRLKWSDLLLDYERHCLKGLPHIKISYDADLSEAEHQLRTTARAFEWIGVPLPPAPVSSGMKKVLPPDPRDSIANYDTLAARLREEGLERLLPAEHEAT